MELIEDYKSKVRSARDISVLFHVVSCCVSKRKLNSKGSFTLDESESEIASRRVHRESNFMFTLKSNKDQRKKFAFPNCE